MAQTAAQAVVVAGTVVEAHLEIVVLGTSELAVGAATQIAEVGMS